MKQDDSRTALFAFVACRLAGVPVSRCEPFLRDLGVAVGRNAVKRAGAAKTRPSALDGRTVARDVRRDGPLRDWLLVDEQRLDLETALVVFPGEGRRRSGLVAALRHTPGVLEILETEERADVIAKVLIRGPGERRRLRARFGELAERFSWSNITSDDHSPSVRTWRDCLKAAADEESLAWTGGGHAGERRP